MNQYIITEELLQEAMENTTWGRTNRQKFRDKLTPYQSERDTVLDDCCNIDLTEYTRGERESDEVGLCRGRECNYCGRYNAEPRQNKTDSVFIFCNTPAHAFRLDLKNKQTKAGE